MRSRRTFLLVAALAGCGGEDAEPTEPTELGLAELCAAWAEADCARLVGCGLALAPERCATRQAEVVCAPWALARARAEQNGEGSWLAVAGPGCVDAAREAGCERGPDESLDRLPACLEAFLPRAEAGEACTLGASCIPGTVCRVAASCPGTCVAEADANEACGPGVPCTEGTFCALTSARCLAQSDLGSPCETVALGSSCRPGAFCDGSQPGGAVCVAARGRGSGCGTDAECAVGLRCVANRCSGGLDGDTCAGGGDCRGPRRCAAGQCEPTAAAEAPCAVDVECGLGLACLDGICAPGIAEGEPCEGGGCARGRCLDGACAPAVPDGGGCADADACLPGRVCAEGACRAQGPFCPL